MNVTTLGALTGVSSLDTITTSSTALTFTSTAPTISVSTAATNISLEAGTTGIVTIAGVSTGGVNIAGSGTGDVNIAGGSGSTGCTITNATGALACSGAISTNGTTVDSGNGASGQVTYFNGTNSLTSDTGMTYTSAAATHSFGLTAAGITTTGTAAFSNTATVSGSALTETYYGQKLSLTNNQTVNPNTLYGQYISFTDAGSLANTVTGLYVDATTANASDTTYAAVFQGGNVGIGTTTPGYPLEVYKSVATSDNIAVGSFQGNDSVSGRTAELRLLASPASVRNFNLSYYESGNLDSQIIFPNYTGLAGGGGIKLNYGGSSTGLELNNLGVIGINISPTYRLDVADATANGRGINIAQTSTSGTNYGLYSSVTGAATTNIGGYFTASGATNNYGLIVANGNVGIGTGTPNNTLQVANLINFDNTNGGTYLGYQAGLNNSGNNLNSFVGYQAGKANTTGSVNSAMGYQALSSNNTGGNNSAMGNYALTSNTTGTYNSAMGDAALGSNTTAYGNSALGYLALYAANRILDTNAFNTAVGYRAGYSLTPTTTGQYNTFLGYKSGSNNAAGINGTAIGAFSEVDCDNCLVLGSVNGVNGATSNTNIGVGTTSPNAALEALKTTEQLRLSYDATHYNSFTTGNTGNLTLAPTGGGTTLTLSSYTVLTASSLATLTTASTLGLSSTTTLNVGGGSAATIGTPSGNAGLSIIPNGTGALNLATMPYPKIRTVW